MGSSVLCFHFNADGTVVICPSNNLVFQVVSLFGTAISPKTTISFRSSFCDLPFRRTTQYQSLSLCKR
uniref:Uncharacterized protein n=1 Tax=Arundo donax TaxID=35708 RepID=A0A0A9F336_ARUDO